MTPRDIIVLTQERNGLSQAQVAEKLGITKGGLSSALSRDDGIHMSIDKLVKWLDALDWQIVVQDMNGDDEFVLDCEDEGVDYSRFRHDRETRQRNRFQARHL